jgi:hypothetical protein
MNDLKPDVSLSSLLISLVVHGLCFGGRLCYWIGISFVIFHPSQPVTIALQQFTKKKLPKKAQRKENPINSKANMNY